VATISRALTRPELLSRQTRERVLQGIERLGYRPNLIARDLRRGQTGTVLVVIPTLAPFFLEIFRGVEQAADELGLAVLMGNSRGDVAREKAYFDQAASRHADGLILLTGEVPFRGPAALRGLPPLVVAVEPVRDFDLPTVGVDHAGGAEEAVRHLINLGHKRIAHIAGPEHVGTARARLAGYRKALKSARLSFDETLVQRGDFSILSGQKNMHVLLQQKPAPTAVFSANDEMAMGAIRALKSLDLKVPEDVSVIGFDDQDFAEIYDPALSTVHIPRFDVGYQAMMMLGNVMSQQRAVKSVILDTRLVIRETSAPPKRR
jgi:LacI family transcriptional regulator, repressor for deo operon, udp, cdd, tsx, nupC, and nupG